MNAQYTLFLLLLLLSAPLMANERILYFHADIYVLPNGELEVTETIKVHAQGDRIRRGIYRDFPTRYRDRLGNQVVVDFEPLSVERDGNPEPWFTENRSNGVRVNTGDDSFLPTPLETTYSLRYRTSRQLGFFDQYDELYWNVTGTGWIFAIDRASARVHLPTAVAAEHMQINYYTGPYGSQAQDAEASVPEAGIVDFATTQSLAPNEGLTLSVTFPKGIVSEPATAQRFIWFLQDNRAQLFLVIGLIAVFAYYWYQWQRKGRGPEPGPVFPRYYPPDGFSPGSLRCLKRMGHYDNSCFSADLVQLAVKGHVIIRREKEGRRDQWTVEEPEKASDQALLRNEKALVKNLFSFLSLIKLTKENGVYFIVAKRAHFRALARDLKSRNYLVYNRSVTRTGSMCSFVIAVLGLVFSTHLASVTLWALVLAFIPLNVVFRYLMPRYTEEGQRLMDHIEGLILYLSVASKEDLARVEHRNPDEPALDAERFESLLPYALALDVEHAWTDKFSQAVGAQEADRAMSSGFVWYHGTSRNLGLQTLGSDLGKSFSSQIASAATPSGTSSGSRSSGGGGFSGGGGGGGGGGGR